MTVTIGLAFLAGLASFLSPCVFSLVPAYVSYLGGRSIASAEGQENYDRWITFTHGVAFVLGFSFVFIMLGLAASALGHLMYSISPWLTKIGGVVVVIFGLHMTGLMRLSFLDYEFKPQTNLDVRRSYFSSFMMGVFFSAGWSPCVGPVLGSILTLALYSGSMLDGMKLLIAYSIGLAIPFLLAAIGIGWVTGILRKHRKIMHYTEVVMGGVLIVIGLMLFFGFFQQLTFLSPWIKIGI
jgi:cytochrome c-type biogenesis protein